MLKLLARLLLTAFAFVAVLPYIPGISFHGTVFQALVLALLFTIVLWFVDLLAIALSAAFTIGTLGMALLWLIPAWIFGFWLMPALALKLVSDFLPQYLSITGWTPAILGGLVMLVIGLLTSVSLWHHARQS
jgi:uncharacterized membrane protein YvlD (DUF360 family)